MQLLEAQLDKFKLFHKIITESDPSSPLSVVHTACMRLTHETDSRRGVWFQSGAGGLLAIASFSVDYQPFDIERQFPMDQVQDTRLNGRPSQDQGHANTSRSAVFLCLPVMLGEETIGVFCLERASSDGFFYDEEMDQLEAVLADIGAILGSSSSHERDRFELDNTRSKLAMSQVGIISNHASMLKLFSLIRKLAVVPSTVLIHGESGTGKELVARAIYKLGEYGGPFIGVNCGGIEANLMKSELFGHVKGSFTGADKHREGFFKRAQDGVLFLDEIGEMPQDMQVALLRTLERNEIIPVGGEEPITVNTRVVAATHRDLAKMVEEGHFRNDLYQRIRGLTIRVPPLRERRGDIELLCTHFVEKYNNRLSLNYKGLKPEALQALQKCHFSEGNIRELEHKLERAMVFGDDPNWIGTEYLETDETQTEALTLSDSLSFEDAMNHYAGRLLRSTLESCAGNKTKAMKRLGLSRSTFYSHLRRLNIQ